MSEEENIPDNDDSYRLMLDLERLESLREDLEELGLSSLAEIEAALALITPQKEAELQAKRELLAELRAEFRDLGLSDLKSVEATIATLNEKLDKLDDE